MLGFEKPTLRRRTTGTRCDKWLRNTHRERHIQIYVYDRSKWNRIWHTMFFFFFFCCALSIANPAFHFNLLSLEFTILVVFVFGNAMPCHTCVPTERIPVVRFQTRDWIVLHGKFFSFSDCNWAVDIIYSTSHFASISTYSGVSYFKPRLLVRLLSPHPLHSTLLCPCISFSFCTTEPPKSHTNTHALYVLRMNAFFHYHLKYKWFDRTHTHLISSLPRAVYVYIFQSTFCCVNLCVLICIGSVFNTISLGFHRIFVNAGIANLVQSYEQ